MSEFIETVGDGSIYRIVTDEAQAVLIDVQERLTPHIHEYEQVVANIRTLILGLKLLGVPLLANEQYPKGLGHTVPELADVLGDTPIFEKVSFSACDDEPTMTAIENNSRPVVIVFGIETHVCVLQTVVDLLDRGYQPVVVADAVGSRTPLNKKLALKRMMNDGAVIASVEMVLFELCRSAKNPVFKEISNLVK